MVERLICNQVVEGSNPSVGSMIQIEGGKTMNIFWIATSIVLSVMLIGTLITLPALYRREARRQEGKA